MSEPAAIGWRYPAALVAGGVGTLLAFIGLLAVLHRTGNLPPPAMTNSLCADEKLVFLRDYAGPPPDVLIVGSSVAWRHFDGAAVVERSPDAQPLNGGVCGMAMNQTEHVTAWLLRRFHTVREVALIAAPQDFEDCTKTNPTLFDTVDADAFLAERGFSPRFYLRYFDPYSLLRNAQTIAQQRAGNHPIDPLILDAYGDAPLYGNRTANLGYDIVEQLDPACFASLGRMAGNLAAEGRRLVVVTTPINPEWRRHFDPEGRQMGDLVTGMAQAVAAAGGTVWDGNSLASPGLAGFTDAIHIRWSAAQEFSRALVRATGLGTAGKLERKLTGMNRRKFPDADER